MSVTKTLTAPATPAGTIVALAFTRPSKEFNNDATGWFCPPGQIVKNDSATVGMTLTFKEYETEDGDARVQHWASQTVTLHRVVNGNARTTSVDKALLRFDDLRREP